MPERNIAPDCKRFAEALKEAMGPEALLFFITVWNEGGEMGVNELVVFISDLYQTTPPDERRKYAERAAERFFSEEAFEEYTRNSGARDRIVQEIREQEGGGANGKSKLWTPGGR